MTESVFQYDADGTPWIPKDARASLDYSLRWDSWLTGAETIASSTWTALDVSTITFVTTFISAGKTTAYISGGVVGENITIRNWVKTNSTPARKEARSFELRVEDR